MCRRSFPRGPPSRHASHGTPIALTCTDPLNCYPNGQTQTGSVNPIGSVQYMDSRVPGTTGPPINTMLYYLGAYRHTYQSFCSGTNCNTPTNSDVKEVKLNGLQCAPTWNFYPLDTRTMRAPAQPIQVYIPDSMWNQNGLSTAFQAAKNDWNTALAGTGVTFERTAVDCSADGGACIQMTQDYTDPGGCAGFQPNVIDGQGVFANPTQLRLPITPADRDWRTRPPNNLRRTIAHELGHAVGLKHPTCTTSDAIMASLPQGTICNNYTPPILGPTANDILPTTSSTYGDHMQKWCNF